MAVLQILKDRGDHIIITFTKTTYQHLRAMFVA